MLNYLGLALCSFVFIFLKSWQQLNVVHRNYWWILPTSMTMACVEVYSVVTMAHNGWGWVVLPIGVGGGLGSVYSTWLHHKYLEKNGPASEE